LAGISRQRAWKTVSMLAAVKFERVSPVQRTSVNIEQHELANIEQHQLSNIEQHELANIERINQQWCTSLNEMHRINFRA
jgi:hypothetical protein